MAASTNEKASTTSRILIFEAAHQAHRVIADSGTP